MSACRNVYTSLLLVLAGASNKELARQVKYLKVENEILRKRIPGTIFVTPAERMRLLKFASRIAEKVLQHLVSIVHPGTMIKWIQDDRRRGPKKRYAIRRGRPKTPENLCKLILKMAKENDWGYTRIMGELKKMGVRCPSRNTVKKILQGAGFDPGPPKGEGSWDEFIKRHADSLWQCDFFSRKILTPAGVRQAFVLAFIHVQSRRVFLSPATLKQTPEWVAQQSEIIVDRARSRVRSVKSILLSMSASQRDNLFAEQDDGSGSEGPGEVAPIPRTLQHLILGISPGSCRWLDRNIPCRLHVVVPSRRSSSEKPFRC